MLRGIQTATDQLAEQLRHDALQFQRVLVAALQLRDQRKNDMPRLLLAVRLRIGDRFADLLAGAL